MYLFYIDESGSPEGWDDQENFVLGGIAVFEGAVRQFSENLTKVQQEFFPDIRLPLEFHAGDIYQGRKAL